jgi:hypothetical protein
VEMVYPPKISSRFVASITLLAALFVGGIAKASLADASVLASQPSAPRAALFISGMAKASPADAGVQASQPSAQCSLGPVGNPPPPSNNLNCRSTNPELQIYLYNEGDTSQCTFDITINWDDGTPPGNFPNIPGGPSGGTDYVTSHTYANPGIFTLQVIGSVASGDCGFKSGEAQFSYLDSSDPYPQGPPITVQTMFSRGYDWATNDVPYNQGGTYSHINGAYREDCSGFVSMAWDLDYSLNTSALASPDVTTQVAAGLSGIVPGDIILKPAHHVFLFVAWGNSAHTRATVMEETGVSSPTPYTVMKTLGVNSFSGFKVYSYNNAT